MVQTPAEPRDTPASGPDASSAELGAVVLSGGRARRLDGVDKATTLVGGSTLLDRVLGALEEVPDVVVVGDPAPTRREVRFVREEPSGAGPAAALLAGLRAFPVRPRLLVVLAVDMPLVTTATIGRLLLSTEGHGAVLVDEDGRRQHLCAVYDTAALLAAAPGPGQEEGLPVHRLVGDLRLAEVTALTWESRDVDTPADLADLRQRLEG